jgi:aspartate aminotransferase
MPEGTFYLFPRTPIPDDIAFLRMLSRKGILAAPGAGFGRSGFMRLSLTLPLEMVRRSVAGFEAAFRKAARIQDCASSAVSSG